MSQQLDSSAQSARDGLTRQTRYSQKVYDSERALIEGLDRGIAACRALMVRRSEVLKNAFERVGMLSRRHEDSLKESVDEFDAVVMKFSLEHDMPLYSSHIQLMEE
eukprot:310948_1